MAAVPASHEVAVGEPDLPVFSRIDLYGQPNSASEMEDTRIQQPSVLFALRVSAPVTLCGGKRSCLQLLDAAI